MRRIRRFKVQNFKSLVDFRMDLPKFTCLIGLNGAGKSTVLQFIDFLSRLVQGDMEGWYSLRRWKRNDLKSKLTNKSNIEFSVSLVDENGEPAGCWDATYSLSRKQCTKERFDLLDFTLETTRDDIDVRSLKQPAPNGWEDWNSPIKFSYEGSILSVLKEEYLPPSILECKRLFEGIESLDLLAPELLRQRTRESSGTLGLGGQNLAAFLHELSDQKRQDLATTLKEAYPRLQGLHAKSLRSGWKQLEISEEYPESGTLLPSMTTEARHINDGMLRLIAILAELESDHQFLLFDEIENGINPELVELVINALTSARQQVLVTTHSPMILNYLSDDVARDGVMYLYKTSGGSTRAVPFFSIPSLAEKLTVMGPGEAFVDTNLTRLADEIAGLSQERP